MDTEKRSALNDVYAASAQSQLDEIWDWNEEHYGADHADHYIEFLEQFINTLGTDYQQGEQISFRPELRFILIRRKSKGHGHIAVYSVDESQVSLLHVFHTAQDWQNKPLEEMP
jgi:plasmid stabilization system protein ParE